MMYNYPFYPFFRRRHIPNYYGYTGYQPNYSQKTITQNNSKKSPVEPKPSDTSDENVMFEIFGIKIYSDDLLLMGLLFFLYNEKVDDQYLFIALILLLLS